MAENGNYVSRAELKAHLDPMREDIAEIKSDVKTLIGSEYENSWLGERGKTLLLYTIPVLISSGIAATVAVILN